MAGIAGISAGTVVATLLLNSNPFAASLQSAKAQLSTFADSSNSASVRFGALGSAMTTVGTTMTKNVSLPILGVGAAALKAGDDFESQMSRVKAISGATGSDFNKLEQDAINLGKTTSFSSMEVAQGMENLASAGFSTNEIITAMPGLLNLAASSGESLASSTDIAASTLRGFGLSASDTNHVADVLAKTAADTNAQVSDMGDALKYISPVASSAGWSLESVSAALGEMANQGIKGSQAGTILRQTFSQLAKPSDEASKLMKQIGFNAFDSQGKMKSLSGIVDSLKQSTKGMTDQQRDYTLTTIFGTESLSGMNVLLGQGSDKLDTLTNSLKNSDGSAAKMAKTMNDNVNGSVKAMMGSLEDMMIKIQQIIAPSVRDFAKTITDLANKFTSLPESTQKTIVNIALVVAAVGPALLIFGKMAKAILDIKKAFDMLKDIQLVSKIVSGLGSTFSFILSPAGLVILAIAAIAALAYLIIKNWGPISTFFKGLWAGILATFNSFKASITSIWNSIKTTTLSVWNNIKTSVLNVIKPIVTSAINTFNSLKTGIMNIFNGIKQFLTGVWQLIKVAVTGPILLLLDVIVGLFTGSFKQLSQDAQLIWNDLKTALLNIWNGIKSVFVGVFQTFVGLWSSIWNGISSIGSSIWNSISSFFSSIWNNISSAFTSTWNNVVSFFTGLPGRFMSTASGIGSSIESGFNSAISFIESLPGKAIQWGEDFINGLINGIKGAVGGVVDAVSGVADTIRSFLHFSVPDEGPLTDYESWMPDFMSGLAKGITSKKSLVTNAIKGLSTDMSLGLNANVLGVKNASTSSQGDYSTIAAMLTDLTSALQKWQPVFNLNGKEFAYANAPDIDKALGWIKNR